MNALETPGTTTNKSTRGVASWTGLGRNGIRLKEGGSGHGYSWYFHADEIMRGELTCMDSINIHCHPQNAGVESTSENIYRPHTQRHTGL